MTSLIAEHLINLDLLPEKANILDIGCRGFIFTDEMRRRGHNVYSIDPDPYVISDYINKGGRDINNYHQIAIGGENTLCGLNYSADPQATTIVKANIPLAGCDIPVYTLDFFSEVVGITFWDYIKTDVEGSEYEIIMSLTKAPSTQFECEFHLHTGVYTEKEVDKMVDKLQSLGYGISSHAKTHQHGLCENYWSSLFIL